MTIRNEGAQLFGAFDRFMPCYFRYISPILHKTKAPAYQLNENQIKILMALNFAGSATPTQLSRCFYMPKGSLTTILRSLSDMGLIHKQRALDDERKYYVSVTEKAKALIRQKRLENIKGFETLFAQLPEDDAAVITKGLNTLCAYLDKLEGNYE